MSNNYPQISQLIAIMARLRAPGGCPWDLEQDHKTLKPYLIEEAYEVLEAIDEGDNDHLKEELGDLFLQVVFHAQIAQDGGRFTIEDVAKDISDKLVRRHPHVFGDLIVNNSDTVLKNWDEIKKIEKTNKGIVHKSVLQSVSRALPALYEAGKISKKAAKLGFDWKKPGNVFDKIDEELAETRKAIKSGKKNAIEDELGDVLFTVANLCCKLGVNPEMALKGATQKFRKRFANMEARLDKKKPESLSLKEWNELWTLAKKKTKQVKRKY
jgi:MazG family protein